LSPLSLALAPVAVPLRRKLDEDAASEAEAASAAAVEKASDRWIQTKGDEECVAARGERRVARNPPPVSPSISHARYEARSGYECGTTLIRDGNNTERD
jgi:hypothetical protein